MAWNIRTSRTFSPDLEVLAHVENAEIAASIVLDASAFPLNDDDEREMLAGQPLKKSGNQYVPWDPATDDDTDLMGILTTTERVPDTAAHSDVPAAMWNHTQWFRADRLIGWAVSGAPAKFRAGLPTCKFS